ncbi:helix-turn-helix domain-containing protein [Streptomyces sp. NPDC018693]|uniref:helix-turn-helix domain-containing protein n=1 Tax=unclassified Streptomyces TaxID=2593676 RepID=UPI00378C99B9
MLRLDTELLKTRAAAKGDNTHEEIARRADVDRSVVTRLFSGSVPSLANVTALAWAYEIPLDELVPKAEPKVEVPA